MKHGSHSCGSRSYHSVRQGQPQQGSGSSLSPDQYGNHGDIAERKAATNVGAKTNTAIPNDAADLFALEQISDEPEYEDDNADTGFSGTGQRLQGSQAVVPANARKTGFGWQALGVFAEMLLTIAAICGLYIAWLMWWTGIQSEHTQQESLQSVSWSNPAQGGDTRIATAQEGDPPVQPGTARDGDLVAQMYIPRFGDQWSRTVVEGTSAVELNKHGLGHYPDTQMPGAVGNVAIAGHRNGYGQPLGDVDKLVPGDSIIIRTQDYWYVYTYTSSKIVLPTEVDVVSANPENPGATAIKRMITLTTCEPKYSTPTHRWISFGELTYWAKVSDGIPKELSTTDSSGAVKFINNQQPSLASQIDSLAPWINVALAVYLVLFISAVVAWRWPARRAIREGRKHRPDASIYGALLRLQPGVAHVRILLLGILLLTAAAALFQWGFPWAANTIPYLKEMSNYVTI